MNGVLADCFVKANFALMARGLTQTFLWNGAPLDCNHLHSWCDAGLGVPIVQDYNGRAELYKPEVIASHLISQHGNDYIFSLRLYQERFTTVIFNTEYAAHLEPSRFAESLFTFHQHQGCGR
jgi:hypothetical protein